MEMSISTVMRKYGQPILELPTARGKNTVITSHAVFFLNNVHVT